MFGGCPRCLFALLGCLVVTSPAVGDETPEGLLAKARDGNRAAIAAIRTMECRYERVPWAGTTPEQAKEQFLLCRGQFWWSSAGYRVVESVEGFDWATREYAVRDGKILDKYSGGSRQTPSLSVARLPQPSGTGVEMWRYLLFTHWGREQVDFLPFHDVLREPRTLRSVERTASNEIRVELAHDAAARLELWFDPKANYLVRMCVMVPARDTTLRWEHEVIEFAEPAAGVFVPTTIEGRGFANGQRTAAVRTVISNLKVNHDLPKTTLRVSDIDGLECADYERRVKFRVDADGNLVGSESPIAPERIARANAGASAPEDPPSEPQTLQTPWVEWALLGAAGILSVGVVWGLVRRFRDARSEGTTGDRQG